MEVTHMHKTLKIQDAGFTLLEIMITTAIMGIIGMLISQVFFTTTRVNTKTELLKDMKQNGQFAMDTISRMIRASVEINSTCASSGSPGSSIQITNPDGHMTTFGCLLDASTGATRIASTSAYSGLSDYLTSKNVTLSSSSCASASLAFTCTSSPDQPARVKVLYTLRQIGTPNDSFGTASQTFETTVSVRN